MPTLETPYRSPIIIVDHIKDIIKDKIVCDLGCACGDILFEMKKYAKEVSGIERLKERVNIAKKRGLNVIEGDILQDQIPEADIYYFWVFRGIIKKVLDKITKGTIILGADPVEGEDKVIEDLNLNGKWIEVTYNEGNGWRQKGIFKLFIIEK